MYKIGDYVRYGAKGIFKIEDIIKKQDQHGKQQTWYVLNSMRDGIETSVVTLVDNDHIRKILDKPAIQHLLDEMPNLATIWDENKIVRYQKFHEIIESGSIYKLAQLAKTIYVIHKEKELCGKQLAQKDKEYLEQAQQLLFEEISLSYHIQEEDVLDMILRRTGTL